MDVISQFLYLLAFASFIYFATRATTIVNVYWIAAVILVICYIYVKVKFARKGHSYYTPGLAIAAVTWVVGPHSNWLMFTLFAACTLIEKELKFQKEIGFTPDEIVFNTLIKKHYEWSEFKNLLIKDGLITLDFKSNKLIQKEIDGEVSADIEKEFNEFCREQLEVGSKEDRIQEIEVRSRK